MNGFLVLDIKEGLLNMKKIIALGMMIVLAFCTAACGKQGIEKETLPTGTQVSDTQTSTTESEEMSIENSTVARTLPEPEYGNTRICFSWEDKEIIVRLIDNEATENLLCRLPLALDFEDYRGRQKTGVIPDGLELGHAPGECDCFVGDMNYYAPWNMLTFFYDDFGYAPDLTPLGMVESGLEYLEEIDGGSTVTISIVE